MVSGDRGRLRELIGNTVLFAFGTLGVKLVSFVLMPLYTTVMTVEEYGVAELANNSTEVLLPVMSLGAVEALYRFSIDEEVQKRSLFTNSVILLAGGAVCVGVMCAVARVALGYTFALPVFVLFASVCSYKATAQFARGCGHVKRYVLYGMTNAIALLATTYWLVVHAGGGVSGYLWSYSIAHFAASAIAFVASREFRFLSWSSVDLTLLKRMLGYSLPLVPNLIAWWVVSISGRYIVLWCCGAGDAGIFTAASKLPAVINLGTSVFQLAWQYSASKAIGSPGSGVFFVRVLRGYAWAVLLLSGAVIALSRQISSLLLRSDFGVAWRYVPLLMLAAAFGALSIFFESFYQALMDNRMLMVSTLVGAVVNVIVGMLLSMAAGLWGAVFGMLSAYVVMFGIRAYDIRRRMSLPMTGLRIYRQLALVGVIAGVSSFEASPLSVSVTGASVLLLLLSDLGIVSALRNEARVWINTRVGRGVA
ncbi:Membrane protein involved in the export of O-antigen and teichoic acid [Actinomyces ruminicola]|uniref:Membrane protein involved in the export of O-antigen and teichoic acid n=1 Tax=Actinomyces ruminicola TaxID=332524 RepID=A0A1G9ZEN1_9ACTO|nr:oligosaccharide flippase family protein [Actinomyces ruminicola]SDN19615.1 Membrane protein involved in the export of O-antigen and teichoic acid [Actinomyces ruminicola]